MLLSGLLSANSMVMSALSGAGSDDRIQETTMFGMNSLQKRMQYRRTVRELKNLPVDTALDLDIYPGDAKKIAHRAVYGH